MFNYKLLESNFYEDFKNVHFVNNLNEVLQERLKIYMYIAKNII
jgi:hypothetical protein